MLNMILKERHVSKRSALTCMRGFVRAKLLCLCGITMLLALLLTVALLLILEPSAQAENFTWLIGYRDKGENALAWDKRFVPFLQNQLPSSPLPNWSNAPVNQAAATFLDGVPGYVEVRHSRYFAASGCPAHACVARALLWVDTQLNLVIFAATGDEENNHNRATSDQYPIASAKLYFATKDPIEPAEIPDEFRGAVIRWLHLEGVLTLNAVTLLSPSGPQQITSDQLCWAGRCASIHWN